ncbi:MAG: hypothetical protein WC080_02230 [Patescibacteria group bacterium]|jgi:hypothetical protein
MNHNDLSNLIRTVQKNVRCPQCGKQYCFDDIKIRGVVDSVCFLELLCKDHMPLLATVMLNDKAAITNKSGDPIISNDVIETHKFLKEFKGTFQEIFKQEI